MENTADISSNVAKNFFGKSNEHKYKELIKLYPQSLIPSVTSSIVSTKKVNRSLDYLSLLYSQSIKRFSVPKGGYLRPNLNVSLEQTYEISLQNLFYNIIPESLTDSLGFKEQSMDQPDGIYYALAIANFLKYPNYYKEHFKVEQYEPIVIESDNLLGSAINQRLTNDTERVFGKSNNKFESLTDQLKYNKKFFFDIADRIVSYESNIQKTIDTAEASGTVDVNVISNVYTGDINVYLPFDAAETFKTLNTTYKKIKNVRKTHEKIFNKYEMLMRLRSQSKTFVDFEDCIPQADNMMKLLAAINQTSKEKKVYK